MQPPVATTPEPPRSKDERYREILATLAKHGFGAIGDHFVGDGDERDQSRAERLRQACEELGTMFIKLGQMLSTRGDLLPEAYRLELAKLVDDVPPLPVDVITQVIREELGAAPETIFAFFDPVPLGSASIGQVHSARLVDGRDVVVKVRKPGVEALVQIDLKLLVELVDTWAPRFPGLNQYDAKGVVREFSESLLGELDYRREATNEKFFRSIFSNEPGFAIPDVIAEYSTGRVLTHERVDGRKVSDVAGLSNRRRATVSQRIARFVLEPAFEHGVFYADPHSGNLMIQEDGALAVVDFGTVGRLTPEARRRVAGMFLAISRRDAERLTDRVVEVTSPRHPIDRQQLTNDVERLLEQFVDVSFDDVPLGNALGELLHILRRHQLRLPSNLAAFIKALVMCEGILQSLDPESSLTDYLQPMAGKLIYQGIAGGDGGTDRLRDSALDAAQLSIELPRRIDRVLGEIERGNLRVWTRIEDADPIMKRVEHMVERANVTMLAAACIVGLAIVLQLYHPQGWQQWIGVVVWIGLIGAVAATIRTLLALRRRS
ncbi:MAG: ubiquinone biosynthesis protein [Candidatus Eremiobacteraeota bacterium]|nr:ubiquinone biosynthesis protein [Candidatus Eremiobacteraeota bacterium]